MVSGPSYSLCRTPEPVMTTNASHVVVRRLRPWNQSAALAAEAGIKLLQWCFMMPSSPRLSPAGADLDADHAPAVPLSIVFPAAFPVRGERWRGPSAKHFRARLVRTEVKALPPGRAQPPTRRPARPAPRWWGCGSWLVLAVERRADVLAADRAVAEARSPASVLAALADNEGSGHSAGLQVVGVASRRDADSLRWRVGL